MEARERVLQEYITRTGHNPFGAWMQSHTDPSTRVRIRTRLSRLRLGNFGDTRGVGAGETNGRSPAISVRPYATGRSFKLSMPVRDYKDGLFADLQDPEFAVAYLNAALEEDAPEVFLLHLRDVAEAWGGIGKLATDTQLAREALYRMLSTQGNPQLTSLDKILHALGLRLAVARASAAD